MLHDYLEASAPARAGAGPGQQGEGGYRGRVPPSSRRCGLSPRQPVGVDGLRWRLERPAASGGAGERHSRAPPPPGRAPSPGHAIGPRGSRSPRAAWTTHRRAGDHRVALSRFIVDAVQAVHKRRSQCSYSEAAGLATACWRAPQENSSWPRRGVGAACGATHPGLLSRPGLGPERATVGQGVSVGTGSVTVHPHSTGCRPRRKPPAERMKRRLNRINKIKRIKKRDKASVVAARP